jgi:hypothetical protein
LDDTVDTQPHQIATTQLAMDGEVEERQVSRSTIQLQTNSHGTDDR